MNKKILIALIMVLGVQTQADAQFLKKLGNAIDKAAKTVDKVANTVLGDPSTESNNSTTNNNMGKVGKPYQIGDTKVTIQGKKMPDIILSDLSAARIYSDTRVLFNYQLYNTSMENSYYINMGIGDNDHTIFVDHNGGQYTHGWTDMGRGDFVLYDCGEGAKILDDTKLNCRMLIASVPNSVKAFKRADLPLAFQTEQDYWNTNINYRLDNIPIKLRPCMQRDGVHGEADILLGSRIATLPQAVDSIYDHYTVSDYKHGFNTYKQVTFYMGNDPVFHALSYDNSTLAMMYIDMPSRIFFKVGEHFYRVGTLLDYKDAKFCAKQGDEYNLLFKDMTIITQDDPKSYSNNIITGIYIGKFLE